MTERIIKKERCKRCGGKTVIDCPAGCTDGYFPCPECCTPKEPESGEAVESIQLVCDDCGKKESRPRADYDPKEAISAHIRCPDCVSGFDEISYYDKDNNQVYDEPTPADAVESEDQKCIREARAAVQEELKAKRKLDELHGIKPTPEDDTQQEPDTEWVEAAREDAEEYTCADKKHPFHINKKVWNWNPMSVWQGLEGISYEYRKRKHPTSATSTEIEGDDVRKMTNVDFANKTQLILEKPQEVLNAWLVSHMLLLEEPDTAIEIKERHI